MFSAVTPASARSPQAIVIAHFKGEPLDDRSAKTDADGYCAWTAEQPEATGELGKVVTAYPAEGPERVLIVGLGARDGFKTGSLRNAAAAVARALAAAKVTKVEFRITDALQTLEDPPNKREAGSAFGEGLGLASFTCDQFRGSATTLTERTNLTVAAADKTFNEGMKRGLGLAEAANVTRTLSNTPPNICTPDYLATKARKMARESGLTCTVIKGERLEKEKMTGHLEVGKASENEPAFIRLEYKPSKPKKGAKPIVLIGKTITYDSGGLSIKVGGGMRGMKRDKDGGCAVFGAMKAIAEVIKPNVPVVGLLACAENSISDEAYRPDDIITFRNGVTVEVTNTDAEGRLVLADALCWACDKENPAAIIDFATLTGGVVVALGSVFAGMWCDDDALRGTLEEAATASGERVWRLPHDEKYRQMMKSPIADIWNSAPVREAHPIQGAAFLSYFCKPEIPWAHIDIAGTHSTDKQDGPYEAGPTGFGARLAAEAVERLAKG